LGTRNQSLCSLCSLCRGDAGWLLFWNALGADARWALGANAGRGQLVEPWLSDLLLPVVKCTLALGMVAHRAEGWVPILSAEKLQQGRRHGHG